MRFVIVTLKSGSSMMRLASYVVAGVLDVLEPRLMLVGVFNYGRCKKDACDY